MAYRMYVSSGEKIKGMRQEKGLSMEAFARELGCGEEHVRLIEGCDRKISRKMTERLCRILKCCPESILCMDKGILTRAKADIRRKKPDKPSKNRIAPVKKEAREDPAQAGAQRIREARKAAGLTQKELADAIGVPPGAVSAMENGAADIPADTAEGLGRCLSMPPGYFQGDPSPLDISFRIHGSCLLQRLATAAIGCEDSEAIDLAAKMLIKKGRKKGPGKM